MEVRALAEFLVRVHRRSPSVNESDLEILRCSEIVAERCWSAVRSNEKSFFEATAQQLECKTSDHAFGTLSEVSGRDCRAHARRTLLDIISSAAQEGGDHSHPATAPVIGRPTRDGTSPLWAQLHTAPVLPMHCCPARRGAELRFLEEEWARSRLLFNFVLGIGPHSRFLTIGPVLFQEASGCSTALGSEFFVRQFQHNGGSHGLPAGSCA